MKNDSVKIITKDTGIEGPTLLVMGAVHGNEPCGTLAIDMFEQYLAKGDITLTCGKLVLIPISNPEAHRQGIRFVDRNLNRFLFPRAQPINYEDSIGNQLCAVLETADYLLDIHSYKSQGEPFVFLGNLSDKEIDFARALGVPHFVYGWQDVFKDSQARVKESQGTTEYARLFNAQALTLECGNHTDARSVQVALSATINAMVHLGMVQINNKALLPATSVQAEQCIQMKSRYERQAGWSLAAGWRTMNPVKQGDILAHSADGQQTIKAAHDGYIVFPDKNAPVGDKEWFFFGMPTALPKP